MFGFKFRCLKQVTACVFFYFFIALSARVFQGVHLQMCGEFLPSLGKRHLHCHIQLPPGATFNDHNTWIFKDAAQVMYVLENKPCRKKVIYNKKSGYGMMQM